MTADLQVAGIALACSAAVALIGVPLLRMLRARPLWATAAALSIVPAIAVTAGVVGTAQAMFLSEHDLRVVLIVVAVSTVVAAASATRLGRPVVTATETLTRATSVLGEAGYRPARPVPTAELGALARALDEANARLIAARERERALETSRRELVAWISHDLRTPLAGIRATAEALADGMADGPATADRYHRLILADAERLTGMVDDLFELARLQAGAFQLTLEKLSLADVVSDAIAAVDPLARAGDVTVTGSADAGLHVDADATEVGRVLTNLLVNAIRHTPRDGVVEISATARDDRAVFAVADRCGGIPPADLPRLFELGFRGETARTPGGDDPLHPRVRSGIGLAIVRGIVEAHGGDVSVHNHDHGCQFVVALPTAA